ncbi:restriction endonuclease subunit S [Shinella sedimenti]|uniref:Restriction endonuclease subunit S n=1 Tax=Shinella sedimenti TaxID=2919913 RepID=A0ABT0CMH1_9HYPH|nr:restriction endonuclease subunit S [Shinella sedimenti]MCJ8149484.1 restriction endonuclease subunit S [Shinella sedimenti]
MSTDKEPISPKLRFPEFDDDWKEIRFSTFLKPELREVPKPTESYLAIGVRSHGRGTFQKPDADPKAIAMDSLYRVHQNDLIVNITFAWEGAIALVSAEDHGGLVSHRFPTYRFDETTVTHEFFRYIIENKRFRWKLELISPGGAGRNRVLSKQEFLKLEHRFPKLSEQKKVSTFLGAVDVKLRQLGRKRGLLAAYKRGVMQHLFSQRIRFKREDGSKYPDWEEKKFSGVFSWVRTNNLSRQHLSNSNGTIQNIHYGDIHSKFKANFRQSKEDVPFITSTAPINGFSDEEFCRLGDVVIADASEDYADIGKAIEIVEVRDRSLVAGLHTHVARPKPGELAVGFSGYLLRSASVRKQIVRMAQGISVLGISKANLERLNFHLPHPDEQRKIADFLAALDRRIDGIDDQITQIGKFREGLLQQMFV